MSERSIGDGLYIVIPTAVVQDERLSRAAVLLYGIIGGLSNTKGYCFATNSYLSQLLGVNDRSIRRLLSELTSSEYIDVNVERDDRNEVKGRKITIRSHLIGFQTEGASEDAEKPSKKPKEPRKAYGSQQNVLLTDKQYSDLTALYPHIDDEIENMSLYLASIGKSYKNYYAALLNWMRRRAETDTTRKGSQWDGVDY